MTTALIQNCSHKFFQNIIAANVDQLNIVGETINNNLYQLYYRLKPSYIVFHADLITSEISQFISDFSDSQIRCFLYHDSVSEAIIDRYKNYSNIIHISKQPHSSVLLVPGNLINTQLFFDNKSINKENSIICFLDSQSNIPKFLHEYLYPKTYMPIKLFNMPREPHVQNLGIIDESYKAKLLQNHKYYLSVGKNIQDYTLEAQYCGAIVLDESSIVNWQDIVYSPPSEPPMNYNTFVNQLVKL